jgi:hypothetical protein
LPIIVWCQAWDTPSRAPPRSSTHWIFSSQPPNPSNEDDVNHATACGLRPSAPRISSALRVALRDLTAHVTGKIRIMPCLYRYPYGLTGKMTPGGVYVSICLGFGPGGPPGGLPPITTPGPFDSFQPRMPSSKHFKINQGNSRVRHEVTTISA